ncbi:hypothetical protein EVAR_39122_1 [Eumeta japonica]|uniref:Uncharacterized protein n=1 Tax=Eumeta variegata TaxID=151549 RepID=A0A4C1X6B3_EUMVA|nr:hypothetical protein EVAR_39122_1 [Eumeta japonica]
MVLGTARPKLAKTLSDLTQILAEETPASSPTIGLRARCIACGARCSHAFTSVCPILTSSRVVTHSNWCRRAVLGLGRPARTSNGPPRQGPAVRAARLHYVFKQTDSALRGGTPAKRQRTLLTV